MSTALDDYQHWVRLMWNWQDFNEKPLPLTLRDDYLMATGLGGETGEALEVLKKAERARLVIANEPDVQEDLTKELGDIMYYVAMIAERHGIKLSDVVLSNISKLEQRKAARGKK